MLKIFTTQLVGYFKKIEEKEEGNLEDGARVLAQALIGDGHIYVYGLNEMEAITLEATKGHEPLLRAKPLNIVEDLDVLTPVDRVLLVSRFSTDRETIELAQKLQEKGIASVGLSAVNKEGGDCLTSMVDVHIDTKLLKSLIPDENGNRYGFPAVMTALYAYYGLALTIREMMDEYE